MKAFDTIQHQLPFKKFRSYGLPDSLVKDIEKLYSNFKVKFECNGINEAFDYSTWVQQGDNMSPVLFLFIIQAFLDTIKDEIPPSEFRYFPEHKNGNQKPLMDVNGRLIGQPATSQGDMQYTPPPHFFSCHDVDIQTKHNIYIAFPLNVLLWGGGGKTWNLTSKNL